MRTPRSPELALLAAVVLAATVALLSADRATTAQAPAAAGPAGWEGLLGDRPHPRLGERRIVVLKLRSLADRVRAAGGTASEGDMRAWTRAAAKAQRSFLTRLMLRGAFVEPEFSYVRVLNGFAASIDARTVAALEREPLVAGVYSVRAAYPATEARAVLSSEAFAPGSGRRPEAPLPGFTGRGVTVALLDTGVDVAHPYLHGRLLEGIDLVDPAVRAVAQPHPTIAGRTERHGTELAGIVVGHGGPSRLRGVAPGALLLPVRVAGWQPDANGGVAVYGRTDQLVAGLEAAVDPDGNGETHDAARVALVGVVEPFAAFGDGPLARAAAGALALDTLVVAPAGNDGPAGPSYGSVGGPGGAPAALTVGAADLRTESPSVHVLLRAGLRVLLAGEQPLGGAVAAGEARALPVRLISPRTQTARGGVPAYFDAAGRSVVAGAAALLPPGASSPEAVREAAVAGARAVLVDGPLPAGALGLDEPFELPVLGLPRSVARLVREHIGDGVGVTIALGASRLGPNAAASATAPFSSRGLAFDGTAKPEIAAAGVGMVTADPGRGQEGVARYGAISGSSAAAAVVAGAAAVLAEARPDLDAAALKSALVAAGRPLLGEPAGARLVEVSRAAFAELVADPPVLAVGSVLGGATEVQRTFRLRNVSRRRLVVRLSGRGPRGAGVAVRVTPKRVRIRAGRAAVVTASISLSRPPDAPADVRGELVARAENGGVLRVPWIVAVPQHGKPLVGQVRLRRTGRRPTDRRPWILSFVAGRVDGTPDRPQLLPLERVDVDLYRGAKLVGTLARVRDVLPGRYRFALTGRGPRGARLRSGSYELRIVAQPVAGGEPGAWRLRLPLG